MNIKIDYREKELINLIKEKNENKDLNILVENLSLGDIIIEKNDKEIIIIERKTLNDLAASIKDGRYNEQSLRLNAENISNHNIIYLIEGNILNFKQNRNININTLISCFTSLMYFKGFSVFKVINTIESAYFILGLANKINKENKECYYKDNEPELKQVKENEIIDDSYTNVIKRVKKDNITVSNIDVIMLSQIPNVSVNVANIIIEKYKNIKNLINNLELSKDCLNDMYITNTENKKRKISKKTIENIYIYLIKNEVNNNLEI